MGAIERCASASVCSLGRRGEKGGVGVSEPDGCCAEPWARGVRFDAWLWSDAAVISPVRGVSEFERLLRGVPLFMVNLRVKPVPEGMTISDSGCGCASMDASIEWRKLPLVLLSLRRSRRVFSPRRARARAKPPAELAVDVDDSAWALELSWLELSLMLTSDVRFGDSAPAGR